MSFEVSAENEDLGPMKGVFLDGNGLWLILMQPTGPGPGMDSLHEMGDGTIFELDFEARDHVYDDVLAEMIKKGINPDELDEIIALGLEYLPIMFIKLIFIL